MANIKITSLNINTSSIVIGYENSGGDNTGWSKPMNNLGHHDGTYQYDTCCNNKTCVTGDCGQTDPLPSIYDETKQKVTNLCNKQFKGSEMTFGHGMYDEQVCGECVLLKCDDSMTDARKCSDYTPFYQMKTDLTTWSREIGTDAVNAHWGGVELAQENQWYVYKKTPCPF